MMLVVIYCNGKEPRKRKATTSLIRRPKILYEQAHRYHIHSLLQSRVLLSPLCRNILLGELPRLTPQHSYALFMRELRLFAYGYHAAGDMVVVLPQKIDG